jgi:protein-L-isoaspartate(D-aspartate) O-methyltransferase
MGHYQTTGENARILSVCVEFRKFYVYLQRMDTKQTIRVYKAEHPEGGLRLPLIGKIKAGFASPAAEIIRAIPLVLLIFFFLFSESPALLAQNFERLRNNMVETQLKQRNIRSVAVLEAMRTVPRHLFVPQDMQRYAYNDSPLPIGLEQTISQPYIVAFMTEQLNPVRGMKILEIGTGSGYQAAILAQLGCDVFTIELLEELARRAEKVLTDLNYSNVKVKCGNGYAGWPEEAPFDAIIVTAAPDKIPEALIEQLKDGGRMIVPVGPVQSVQSLKLITKKDGKITEKELLPVRFVPMVE